MKCISDLGKCIFRNHLLRFEKSHTLKRIDAEIYVKTLLPSAFFNVVTRARGIGDKDFCPENGIFCTANATLLFFFKPRRRREKLFDDLRENNQKISEINA